MSLNVPISSFALSKVSFQTQDTDFSIKFPTSRRGSSSTSCNDRRESSSTSFNDLRGSSSTDLNDGGESFTTDFNAIEENSEYHSRISSELTTTVHTNTTLNFIYSYSSYVI